MSRLWIFLSAALLLLAVLGSVAATQESPPPYALPAGNAAAPAGSPQAAAGHGPTTEFIPMLFVFLLASFIGLGVIRRVSRLLHTPLMSLTNAISAIAVVGAILVVGPDYPEPIRIIGAVALFASMTNIVSGFLITDRMLKMFKSPDSKPGDGDRK